MQGSYFKTAKEKNRKYRNEDAEHRQYDREFEKKRQKYRDERRKQKRGENWTV